MTGNAVLLAKSARQRETRWRISQLLRLKFVVEFVPHRERDATNSAARQRRPMDFQAGSHYQMRPGATFQIAARELPDLSKKRWGAPCRYTKAVFPAGIQRNNKSTLPPRP
jgi:hypothetical protein